MRTEEWERVEAIFHQVATLPDAERGVRLTELCGSNAELFDHVNSLLFYDGADAGAYRMTAVAVGADLAQLAGLARGKTSPWIGERLGAYRILSPLGEGGMGMVFTATRDDAEFDKTVAIKVIRDAQACPAGLGRFLEERQILARLEHPYITRLLDGGAAPDGTPFIVMELVAGEPLTAWCDARNLAIAGRLRLFLRVCEAVRYAHEQLVVHRDLKPVNILVTAAGEPKLLDFGVAKMIDPSGARDATRTLAMLTPDYASPEQVRGEPAGTSSDIYALGAILHELLSGQKAHALSNLGPAEITDAVCVKEPRPASDAAPESLRRWLRGDLDAIISKAMRKEAAERYRSVEQFALDIRNHLEGRPVEARRGSSRYRALKFVRRHALPIGAVAAVILALIGGVIATERQARRAEQRFEQVRQLTNDILLKTNNGLTQIPGTTAVRAELAATAQKYFDSLYAEVGDEPTVLIDLVRGYERLAAAQSSVFNASLGDSAAGLANYRKAIEMGERLVRLRDRPAVSERELARVYLRLATELQAESDDAGLRRSLARLKELGGIAVAKAPTDKYSTVLLIGYWNIAGDLEEEAGNAAGAEDAFRHSLALAQRETGDQRLGDEAVSSGRLAGAFWKQGKLQEAWDANRHAIANWRKLRAADANNVRTKRNLAEADLRSATLLAAPWSINLGKPAQAPAEIAPAVALLEENAKDKQDSRAQFDLAAAYVHQAETPRVSPASLSLTAKAIAILESQYKLNSGRGGGARELGRAYSVRGEALVLAGKRAEAEASFGRALEVLLAAKGYDSAREAVIARARLALGPDRTAARAAAIKSAGELAVRYSDAQTKYLREAIERRLP